jgi:hypothetical protein
MKQANFQKFLCTLSCILRKHVKLVAAATACSVYGLAMFAKPGSWLLYSGISHGEIVETDFWFGNHREVR